MPATSGMKGEGFYDQHSSPQMAAIEAVLPWLEDAVVRSDWESTQSPIVVADFGCSEGRNSIAAMRRVVKALRARRQRPIQTIYSDLYSNNFNQLFLNLAAGEATQEQVYAAAVGGSMFQQLLPPQTVSIATTFNALGWLDRRPDVGI